MSVEEPLTPLARGVAPSVPAPQGRRFRQREKASGPQEISDLCRGCKGKNVSGDILCFSMDVRIEVRMMVPSSSPVGGENGKRLDKADIAVEFARLAIGGCSPGNRRSCSSNRARNRLDCEAQAFSHLPLKASRRDRRNPQLVLANEGQVHQSQIHRRDNSQNDEFDKSGRWAADKKHLVSDIGHRSQDNRHAHIPGQ